MSLDERLFGRLHQWWTSRRQNAAAANHLDVEALAPMLQRLAPLLAGKPLAVVFGDEPAVLGERIVLPRQLSLASGRDDAWQMLLWRLALSAAAHATDTTALPTVGPIHALRAELPTLRTWLDEEWPAALDLQAAATRHATALGHVGDDPWLAVCGALPRPSAPSQAGTTAAPTPATRDAMPHGTERKAKGQRTAEAIEVDRRDDGATPLAHVFEKVKTAEEHTGGNRAMDGSDELADHLAALEELDLRRVVRSHHATASVFRADLTVETAMVELSDTGPAPSATIPYDEWDEKHRPYLPGWCAIHATHAPPPPDPVAAANAARVLRTRHAALLRTLRLEFHRLQRHRAVRRRQPSGPNHDLDAIVEQHGAVVAARAGCGTAGEARLYEARRAAPPHVATLILLDRSLSSDSWVQGHRVLDTARNATLLLGDVLQDVQLSFAVATFCSHSRRDCRFDSVKDFAADWHRCSSRLFGLRPDGYTRIGPAIRHATALLAKEPARHRLLLVVSDCKPVDYDHYEGRHGTGDVRQALREASRVGVKVLALAIDGTVGTHLPRMFGPQGFRIVPNVAALTTALARLHERLLH